ncbi:MAG: class I SAM-dependent methyltransferase [Gammaproteobacteria bacterium]|nr:class I SAM-dependent methyltransferase [Gammaproteobacteria bacterium]MDE2346377.1 class I SAM-dependent methyltransferase [Gammaproteobacteria bacterium]
MIKRICGFFTLLAGLLLVAASASAGPIAASSNTTSLLNEAVNGSWRSAAHKERDQYRHPVQTLEFFGIRPDMTVVELEPGGGWYTEILAPFLYDHGHLVEAAPPVMGSSGFMYRMASAFDAKLKADPAVFGHIKLVAFAPPKQLDLGPDNSADMVLTFRNLHDWMNHSPETLAAVFKAAYAVLKPGGVFGVVEHRAKPFANAVESSRELHRLPEDYVIALGLKTGFRLQGVSDINANPKDPEDINVHQLPPDLAGPDSEHAKMKAIGESDRMTLKFVKP